jgi:hypothetical protein
LNETLESSTVKYSCLRRDNNSPQDVSPWKDDLCTPTTKLSKTTGNYYLVCSCTGISDVTIAQKDDAFRAQDLSIVTKKFSDFKEWSSSLLLIVMLVLFGWNLIFVLIGERID